MFKPTDVVQVYNKCPFKVVLKTNRSEYLFDPVGNGVTMHLMTWEEVEYANVNTQLFKDGTLGFEDIASQAYKQLHIDEADILTSEMIKDTILHPTTEKLMRLINTPYANVISRARAILISLQNDTSSDISLRVSNLLMKRYEELNRGFRNTKLAVANDETEVNPEVLMLHEQIAELKKQIAMLGMMPDNMNDSGKVAAAAARKPRKKE